MTMSTIWELQQSIEGNVPKQWKEEENIVHLHFIF